MISFYKELGQRIREQRKIIGMTQNDLAEMVNLSRPSIVNIEQGRQRAVVHVLVDISCALRVAPSLLLPAWEEDYEQS
jgi:transcriptional regulator with XRE-family HTH domain